MAIASSITAAIIAASAGAGSAAISSRAAGAAGRRASDAANYGADRQLEAQREALAHQRREAQNAYRENETTRRANYDQWAAGERRRGTVGEMLGFGAREIPAYVASPVPTFDEPAPGSVGALTAGPRPRPTPRRRYPSSGSVGSYL